MGKLHKSKNLVDLKEYVNQNSNDINIVDFSDKCLDYSIVALDKLANMMNSLEDRLKYNENDLEAKEELEILEFIFISVSFCSEQFLNVVKSGSKK